MFFFKDLVACLKASSTKEEFYNSLLRLFNSITDGTYHSLLRDNHTYQKLLAELDQTEHDLETYVMDSDASALLDRHLLCSDQVQEISNCMAYFAGMADLYHFINH